jgi:preprotein translocase subunit SecE
MAMNRETKRMLQRQGQLDAEGNPKAQRRQQQQPTPAQREKRLTPGEYVREVRAELRKVAWPTRPEVINYSVIVLVAVVLLTGYVAALDYGFGDLLLKLFQR